MTNYKIIVKKKFIFYYWVLKAANGKVLGTSETYSTKGKAVQTATMLSKVFKIELEIR